MTSQPIYQRTPEQAAAWRRFQQLLELDRRAKADPRFLSLPPRVRHATSQPRS